MTPFNHWSSAGGSWVLCRLGTFVRSQGYERNGGKVLCLKLWSHWTRNLPSFDVVDLSLIFNLRMAQRGISAIQEVDRQLWYLCKWGHPASAKTEAITWSICIVISVRMHWWLSLLYNGKDGYIFISFKLQLTHCYMPVAHIDLLVRVEVIHLNISWRGLPAMW